MDTGTQQLYQQVLTAPTAELKMSVSIKASSKSQVVFLTDAPSVLQTANNNQQSKLTAAPA